MGIFSHSKQPSQPPLPTITIHLDEATDKIFRPDDIVTGHVNIVPVGPIAPEAIEVSLFGQSIVWYAVLMM